MKILLTNTLMLNGGEAATVYAITGLLRRTFGADTEIVVYESAADAAAKRFPDFRFRSLVHDRVSRGPRIPLLGAIVRSCNRGRFLAGASLWRADRRGMASMALTREEAIDLELYSTADLIVSSGGTYLVGNYDISARLFDYELCLRLGKPLVFFTQSMGPFRSATRNRLRAVLDRAALILLRDEPSRRHVRELGVSNPSMHLCGDAAYALLDDAPRTAAEACRNEHSRPRVAVSVRNWHYFRTMAAPVGMACYKAGIAAAVTRLIRKHGAAVDFISTCQGIPEYWFDDAAVARQILKTLPADVQPHVRVDGEFRTPDQMIATLQSYDMAIATRFHMAILAMLARTPALAISYEFKTHELYRGVGLADWVEDIEPLHEDAFAARVERCFAQREAARPEFARAVSMERERALLAADLIRDTYATCGGARAGVAAGPSAIVPQRPTTALVGVTECAKR